MKTGARPGEPEELLARIREFVRNCREPALLEPGEKLIPLDAAHLDLQIQGGRVVLYAWSGQTSLVRRIDGVTRAEPARLELAIRRLGRGDAWVALLDLARAGVHVGKQAARLEFRERLRRLLAREFSGWEIRQISGAADLEHSLSPAYARALMTRGQEAFAAIAADESAGAAADQILSFGLIWLDYLRRRERRRAVRGLRILLPENRSAATARRMAFLDPEAAAWELYEFAPDHTIGRVDERNYGNLATTLPPALPVSEPQPPVSDWVERLTSEYGAERVARADGTLSLRVRGLEFARAWSRGMSYGLDGEEQPVSAANLGAVEELAAAIASARHPDAGDPQHPLYRAAPERWLESLVRRNPAALDGTLRAAPLYAQTPAMAGADRGILDLLAVDRSGRLAVLELKASEDIHLPLQGLDYWMRVKWHLDRGEFPARGYFHGIELRPAPPRLVLVSPAFDFHPTTETILRYFSPGVEVERVGLGMDWRRRLQVVFRARGAERPA